MPPSQLKQLKASLREKGITGPPKSKKEKRQSQGGNVAQNQQRQAALQQIRDAFNPFEIKAAPRPAKFASMSDRAVSNVVARPGVSRSMGEKTRRQQLLPELQRRNKAGGIVDRRIGEDDSTMTPEEKALQRFVREKTRRKNGSMFDLEGDGEEAGGLTHLGKALDLDGEMDIKDDFDAGSLEGSDDELTSGDLLKRRRTEGAEDGDEQDDGDDDQPERKKSRTEVMKEVMAKSKLHKYERQKAKEDDDELREKLDEEMGDMLALLRGRPRIEPKPTEDTPKRGPHINPERLAMLEGKSRDAADKEYDTRLRQMASDARAAPADRTKTEDEKAKEEAARLKKLEDHRQRRMRGESLSSEESGDEKEKLARDARGNDNLDDDVVDDEDDVQGDAAEFGLGVPTFKAKTKEKLPVLDDEDEFELDDDLVASDSDMESGSEMESDDEDETAVDISTRQDEEDEFVKGILDDQAPKPKDPQVTKGIAFTYQCPRSHEELLGLFATVDAKDIAVVTQRIRALYHPSLSAENKEKLADFSQALVEHLSHLGANSGELSVIETITRHLHSLSRTYPERIATAFRDQLRSLHERVEPHGGDLVVLGAIGSIYPTSDHFHQVVTPAITLIARWLGMTNPTTPRQLATGAYLVRLSIVYQRISKRYVPEAIRFTHKALRSPNPAPHLSNLAALAELHRSLSAFPEIFHPFIATLTPLTSATKTLANLRILLAQSLLARRPLALHNHRPQPIRTSVPKFEDNFAPGKHYDPDRERAESAKLRREYRREHKGAVRELRKDASFVAREQLREKREADAAYEKKYRRLVAEINSGEGREGNLYERERERRKKSKK